MSGIICSNSNEQETKLKRAKLDGIRVRDFSNLPTFTFITSTGFQGIDLDDPEAMNVVVSSGNTKDYLNGDSPSMMLDLRLDIKQAVSRNRNRNNPNADRFVFFYNLDIFDIDVPALIGKIDALQQRIEEDDVLPECPVSHHGILSCYNGLYHFLLQCIRGHPSLAHHRRYCHRGRPCEFVLVKPHDPLAVCTLEIFNWYGR